MYEAYFGLTEKPFSILPDPEFIFWSGPHTMAFSMMEYGMMNRAGFTVITGEIGCGKTTLISKLLSEVDDSLTVGLVNNFDKNAGDLLRWVLMSLDQPIEDESDVLLFKRFQDFVIAESAQRRRVMLIIDEAQNLGSEALEKLRMLSNINTGGEQSLQFILVGQPQLKDLLNLPKMKQFAQRISSDFHLRRLRSDEVPKYIDHRLQVVGAEAGLFSKQACDLIFEASGGVPRIINIICDMSMIYAFSKKRERISVYIVREVVQDKKEYGVLSFGETAAR